MSNRNIPNYAINWEQQLVTVDEMNIQLAQLVNNVAYLTDNLVSTIINGAEVLKASTTSIDITAGVFRLPDDTTSNPAPYNVAVRFYAIEDNTLTGLTTNGTYYLVARLITDDSDPDLIEYTGEYQLVASVTADDTPLALVVVAGNVISSISYLSLRANDLNYILTDNFVQLITTTSAMPTTGSNFQLSPGADITVTLKNLTSVPGGLYNRKVYKFNNSSIHNVTFVPNGSMSGCKIVGLTSYVLSGYSSVDMFYDQISNSWVFI